MNTKVAIEKMASRSRRLVPYDKKTFTDTAVRRRTKALAKAEDTSSAAIVLVGNRLSLLSQELFLEYTRAARCPTSVVNRFLSRFSNIDTLARLKRILDSLI